MSPRPETSTLDARNRFSRRTLEYPGRFIKWSVVRVSLGDVKAT
jgi:hypothetical protein